jgi:catechol 2,3-dioxygenase-like lactoylglutathione lyase family enzyme
MPRIILLLPALLALTVMGIAHAEPVPAYQRTPVDVRRTTLIVRDLERSLAFYRDALGLKVIYDQVLRRPPPADNPEAGERAVRMALLRANDDFVGIIGLLEYQNPRLPEPPGGPGRPGIGDVMMVFNTNDLTRRFENARNTPGVTIASEPALLEYPGDGGETIPVMVSSLWDPDGYFIELSQILGTPLGQQPEPESEPEPEPEPESESESQAEVPTDAASSGIK